MYELFVSHSCGIDYFKETEAETFEELKPRIQELDDDMLRWYVDKDGEQYLEEICSIHRKMISFLIRKNDPSR